MSCTNGHASALPLPARSATTTCFAPAAAQHCPSCAGPLQVEWGHHDRRTRPRKATKPAPLACHPSKFGPPGSKFRRTIDSNAPDMQRKHSMPSKGRTSQQGLVGSSLPMRLLRHAELLDSLHDCLRRTDIRPALLKSLSQVVERCHK